MQREFYYVNLNSNESIFLFPEKYTDYHVVVEKMYRFFAYQFDSECYFAVSKEIEDRKNLAEEFKALEGMLEEQFYQPHQHLFFTEKSRKRRKQTRQKILKSWNRSRMIFNIKICPISVRIFRNWKINTVPISSFQICM